MGLAHVHQAKVAGHSGHAQHIEPLGERAHAQVNLDQAVAPHVGGFQAQVFLHAKAGAHIVAHGVFVVLGRNHAAHAACAHHFANRHGWDVALAFVHPAAHGRVQRQGQGLQHHGAVGGLGHGFRGAAPVGLSWQAHGACGQADLVVDERVQGDLGHGACIKAVNGCGPSASGGAAGIGRRC